VEARESRIDVHLTNDNVSSSITVMPTACSVTVSDAGVFGSH